MGQNFDEETNPEDLQIDFHLFHKDVWDAEILPQKPEWKNLSFDHFSRGRAVYEILKHKFVIYLPRSFVFPQEGLSFLAEAFQLPAGSFAVNDEIYKRKKDWASLGSGIHEKLLL